MQTNANYMGLILAAGQGTRMKPFSKFLPKPLLPVATKPILGWGIDLLKSIGVTKIIVVVGYKYRFISGYLRYFHPDIKTIIQEPQLGTAHAIATASRLIDRNFVLLYGDNIFLGTLHHVLQFHQQKGCKIVLAIEQSRTKRSEGCVLLNSNQRVLRLVSRPNNLCSMWKTTGFSVCSKDVARLAVTTRKSLRGEYKIETILRLLIKQGEVYGAPIDIWRSNITIPRDFLAANWRVFKTKAFRKRIYT